MFSQANLNRVWTSVTFEVEDADGNVHERTARFLVEPMKRREYQQRTKEKYERAAAVAREQGHAAAAADAATDAAKPIQQVAEDVIAGMVSAIEAKIQATDEDVAQLLKRTHDWRVLDDETGEPIPFTREGLAALLEYDWFFQPYMKRFAELCEGVIRKNLQPGRAGVQA